MWKLNHFMPFSNINILFQYIHFSQRLCHHLTTPTTPSGQKQLTAPVYWHDLGKASQQRAQTKQNTKSFCPKSSLKTPRCLSRHPLGKPSTSLHRRTWVHRRKWEEGQIAFLISLPQECELWNLSTGRQAQKKENKHCRVLPSLGGDPIPPAKEPGFACLHRAQPSDSTSSPCCCSSTQFDGFWQFPRQALNPTHHWLLLSMTLLTQISDTAPQAPGPKEKQEQNGTSGLSGLTWEKALQTWQNVSFCIFHWLF